MVRFILVILINILFALEGWTQYSVSYHLDNTEEVTIGKRIVADTIELVTHLDHLLDSLRQAGHISASIDKVSLQDSTYHIDVYKGLAYVFGQISTSSSDQWILSKSKIQPYTLEGLPYNQQQADKFKDEVLKVLTNTGYPFAKVNFDSLQFIDKSINTSLLIQKNEHIAFDSISVQGNVNITDGFLYRYLELNRGDPYNNTDMLNLGKKLRDLPFLEIEKEPNVTFLGTSAIVNLYLKNRRSSRFDFLIGVQPSTEDGEQKFTFAFDGTADMHNKLGLGEHLFFQYKQLRPETQELKLQFNYPYILNLPFGIDFNFEIFRNARTSIDLDLDIGWQYFFKGNNYLKAYWKLSSSRLVSVDTMSILLQEKLPSRLDVRYRAGGLELQMINLNYRFNPSKGYAIKLNGLAGFKNILPNNEIKDLRTENIDFSESYDSLSNRIFQYEFEAKLENYIPIGKRSTLKNGIQAGLFISKEDVYDNELYRIGGTEALRGFDEKSLLAEVYAILTTEYRLLIGPNSYISTFVDYGRIKREVWDNAFGLGAGLTFETGAGIFGISTAVGRIGETPFDFRNAKVHFGFLSLF